MPQRILLVDDDAAVRRALTETLVECGYEVHPVADAEQALARVQAVAPDVVLTDVRMPGMDGLTLLRTLRQRVPDVDVIVMTAFDDMATVVSAMREGAFEFIVKPLRLADIRAVLVRVFDDRRTREAARAALDAEADAHRLDALIGRDPAMIDVYKRVGQLASTRVNALITGETGTGKGVVARAIHYNSAESSHPFISVNCTALPETLLESELFGHVRGAFTGAVGDRRGRFALAGRGTIFLDEVGDTSPEFQAKLLKVLEEREYYPVGADRPERTEARVIAATHRDLASLVQSGAFRQDLYYRLRVVELMLPPLRARPGDIPLLAHHLVHAASVEQHRPHVRIADDAMAALLQHDWSGNVRELENCLRRAVLIASGGVIRAEHLALAEQRDAAAGFPTLEALEGEHVARALALTNGNRTRAAEILGISKPRLYRLLEKHRISSA
ncbi:MAG TPA: sigma-54 dependent transcriptional regulator [Longimicrobiales bacterium]|nr:sigma-54 dependent transcriptional regulator [Longimicrobiales bacterium]